jgi:hypothetical protein
MTTSFTPAGRQSIPLARITIPGTVRELNADHVEALARSIELRGLLVPAILRPAGTVMSWWRGFTGSRRGSAARRGRARARCR